MADNRTGKITQVIGAVLDIKFGSDNLICISYTFVGEF